MLWRQKGDKTYSLGAAANAVAVKAKIEKMVEGCIFGEILLINFCGDLFWKTSRVEYRGIYAKGCGVELYTSHS